MFPDIIHGLPLMAYSLCAVVATCHGAQVIVHTYLVVQEVKTCLQIRAVQSRIIDLSDELHVREHGSNAVDRPIEELYGHHVRHIHAESIDAFPCPEQ